MHAKYNQHSCSVPTNVSFSMLISSYFTSPLLTTTHTQPFNGLWSGTTQVGQYQKKHSPTHTHPGHRTSFINFLYLLRSIASSVFSLHAWQSCWTASPQVLFGLSLSWILYFILREFLHPVIITQARCRHTAAQVISARRWRAKELPARLQSVVHFQADREGCVHTDCQPPQRQRYDAPSAVGLQA